MQKFKNSQVIINSRDRNTGKPSSFNYSILNGIEKSNYIIQGNVAIPKVWYNMYNNDGFSNNTYRFIDNAAATHNFTITPGHYSFTTLSAFMIAQINGATPNTMSFVLDPITNKITISDTGALNFQFIWTNSKFPRYLGFDPTLDLSPANSSFLAPRVLDLERTKMVNIQLSNVTPSGEFSWFLTRAGDNVFTTIPVTGSFGTMVVFEQDFRARFYQSMSSISNFNVRLVDDIGDTLDMNGVDWIMTLWFRAHL